MFVGFAIGFALGWTRQRGGYAISALLALVVAVVMYVVTLGVLPLYAVSDAQTAVVFLVTFASPFIGVWCGNVARRRFVKPS